MKKSFVIILCLCLVFIGSGRKLAGFVDNAAEVKEAGSKPDTSAADPGNDTAPPAAQIADQAEDEAEDGEYSVAADSYSFVGDMNQAIRQNTDTAADPDRPVGSDPLHIHRFSNDIGSSRTLRGKVSVCCFFVDDNESGWQDEECEKFIYEQITPALEFLTAQAGVRGVDLNFEIKGYYGESAGFPLKYDGVVNADLTDGGATTDILERISVNMGYSSADEMTVAQDSVADHDDAVFLTVINKAGRSYTRNLYNESSLYYLDDDVAETCVIFSGGVADIAPLECASTVAHEILHLFGAEDYYGNIRRPLANRYYFFDIMLLNTRNIRRLRVGDMTAFCVGWTDEVPELCYNEVWLSGRFEEL